MTDSDIFSIPIWQGAEGAADECNDLATVRNGLSIRLDGRRIRRSERDALKELTDVDPMDRSLTRSRIVRLLNRCWSYVEAVRWNRFLAVELGLSTCLTQADPLGTALFLRSLIDELSIQLLIDAVALALRDPVTAQIQTWQEHLKALQAHVLPTPATDASRRAEPRLHVPTNLLDLRSPLNDYIHPNYGSNTVALGVAKVVTSAILDSFRATYEHALPAIEASGGIALPPPHGPFDSREELFAHFIERVRAVDTYCARRGRRAPSELYEVDLASPERFALLRDDFLRDAYAPPDFTPMVRDFSELAQRLDARTFFPDGPPYRGWFEFLFLGSRLALALVDAKLFRISELTTLLVARGNGLSAVIAGRSLMEHQAVGALLSRRLEEGWSKLEEHARHKQSLHEDFSQLETLLAKHLAGTKATVELPQSWRERWDRLDVATPLGLDNLIKRGLDERAHEHWSLMSEVIKGRRYGVCDVASAASEPIALQQLELALRVWMVANSRSGILDRIAPFARIHTRIERLAKSDDFTDVGAIGHAVRAGTLPAGDLVPEHDYRGHGSKADPVRFRKALDYFQAFGRFCAQQGLDEGSRRLWLENDEHGDVVVAADGHEVFISTKGF